MIPWWGVLISVVVMQAVKWVGGYFLFKNKVTSAEAIIIALKKQFMGGEKQDGKTSETV